MKQNIFHIKNRKKAKNGRFFNKIKIKLHGVW